MTKQDEYAIKIVSKIFEMFIEGDDNFIDKSDLKNSDNLTSFIHALSTVAPNIIYDRATGNSLNNLEFNQLANRLCFQFGKVSEK